MGLCLPDKIDSLIAALEDGCASEAACWQESPWLAGKLALFLHEEENRNGESVEPKNVYVYPLKDEDSMERYLPDIAMGKQLTLQIMENYSFWKESSASENKRLQNKT